LRSQFDDGDLVVVAWRDTRTLIAAPWDQSYYPHELQLGPGLSAGFIFNYPDLEMIVVFPHFPNVAIDYEGEGMKLVEIRIPYGPFHSVNRLATTSDLLSGKLK